MPSSCSFAPALALTFKQMGHEQWFFYYLSAVIAASMVIYVRMRETLTESTMRHH